MNNQNYNGQQRRAQRNPSSVTRNSSAYGNSSTARQSQNNQNRRQSNNSAKNANYNRVYRSGRTSSNARTPVRRVTSLTPADKLKLQKKEEKRLAQARKEAQWQKEVVRTRGGPDIFMLAIILVLLALGTITVFSASYPLAISEGRDSNYYVVSQVRFLILGGIAMTVFTFLPIKFYKGWAPIVAYAISAVFLAYTAVAGVSEGVASRWIVLPGGLSFQPSEIMKISLIFMLAWYAEKYESQMKDISKGLTSYKWNILYPCIILGVACILVLIGKHLSGTIIVGAIGFFMLIVAGCRLRWLFATIVPVAFCVGITYLYRNPYAWKRITSFTDENADILSDVWQTTQSVYAIGSGGLVGLGLGQSRQKYHYLGNAHTDFIFSIWCEEFGFVGAILLIAIYMIFIWRGYTIAIKAPDKFTMLTAFGITTHVGLQAFLNMCVASDIIMNTGITLPFFSYGGSSLFVLMVEMGILLCISRQSYKKKIDLERDELRIRAGLD